MTADVVDFPFGRARRPALQFRPGDRVRVLADGVEGIVQLTCDDGRYVVQRFDGLRLYYRAGDLAEDDGA